MSSIIDASPPESYWLSFLPLLIIGVVALGVIFLMVFGIFVSRRFTMTLRTGGAVALTLASILLLTGLWSMLLSPTSTFPETKDSFYQRVSIDGLRNWSYPFIVQEGDTLYGSVNGRVYDPVTNASAKAFSVYVYDPDGYVIWSETNVGFSYPNVKALTPGMHRFEVRNLNQQAIDCYVQITVTAQVTYRPLEPFGQWLSLISLPVFGLGIWASGLLTTIPRKKKGPANVYA